MEQLLCHAADVPTGSDAAGQARPRLGTVSFQHRFGSAVNQHVHLHACVTDGVFKQRAAGGGVTFHAARPL
ncbi:MAG: IS91 family transposase, partial [Planctomycetia bacterium]|nr:IS91 family transposase [Planctomycetia bacterium]